MIILSFLVILELLVLIANLELLEEFAYSFWLLRYILLCDEHSDSQFFKQIISENAQDLLLFVELINQENRSQQSLLMICYSLIFLVLPIRAGLVGQSQSWSLLSSLRLLWIADYLIGAKMRHWIQRCIWFVGTLLSWILAENNSVLFYLFEDLHLYCELFVSLLWDLSRYVYDWIGLF